MQLWLVILLMSSSSVVFPSTLHSYEKRRFISPFAPPCYPWLSPVLLLVVMVEKGGKGVGGGDVRRKLSVSWLEVVRNFFK